LEVDYESRNDFIPRPLTGKLRILKSNCAALDYTPAMPEIPELIIRYDESYFPSGAVCSACGAKMPSPDMWIETSEDAITLFAGLFQIHIDHRHSSLFASRGEELSNER
jgi:hypothetical protein